jgi:hypothetical protein
MTQLRQSPITQNELMEKLAKASKIMKKVDNGNYQKGYINENDYDFSENEYEPQQFINQPNINLPSVNESNALSLNNSGLPNVNKINNSKLPDAIKQAMIERPIQQISMNETVDMSFVKGAKRLIEQENGQSKKTPQRQNTQSNNGGNIDMNLITSIVENTVRKVMDEKLNQLLAAQQTTTINETLVLKVGDSIFKGKITGVNKAK